MFVGIDIGTTHIRVYACIDGRFQLIAKERSCIAFTEDRVVVGDAAMCCDTKPENLVFDILKLVGRDSEDPIMRKNIPYWPFKISYNKFNQPMIEVQWKGGTKQFLAEQVVAMMLFKILKIAQARLGKSVTDAVVTVPAYFNSYQRQAIKDATAIAGINVLRIINAPTAAAAAFSFIEKIDNDREILVYDLGGGTLDVAVVEIFDGSIRVSATAGDTRLGGTDFTNNLVEYFANRFVENYHCDPRKDPKAMRLLWAASEQAKTRLSTEETVSITCGSFCQGHGLVDDISRDTFNSLNEDLFKSTLNIVDEVLKDAKTKKEFITDIVLLGGSSRIPRIQELLKEHFKRDNIYCDITSDEALACGAAIQAAVIKKEPVAKDIVIVDAIPLSLGVETANEVMSVLVPKNTATPIKRKQTFTTFEDQQKYVTIKVFEGEKSKTSDNYRLNVFDLTDIPPAPRGVPQITVTFDITADSILTVSAQDEKTGKIANIVLKNISLISQADINTMKTDIPGYFKGEEKDDKDFAGLNSLKYYCFRVLSHSGVRSLAPAHRDLIRADAINTLMWIDDALSTCVIDPIDEIDFQSKRRQLERTICHNIVHNIINGILCDTMDLIDHELLSQVSAHGLHHITPLFQQLVDNLMCARVPNTSINCNISLNCTSCERDTMMK